MPIFRFENIGRVWTLLSLLTLIYTGYDLHRIKPSGLLSKGRVVLSLQGFDKITKSKIDHDLRRVNISHIWAKEHTYHRNMWHLVTPNEEDGLAIEDYLRFKIVDKQNIEEIDSNVVFKAPPSSVNKFFSLPKHSREWSFTSKKSYLSSKFLREEKWFGLCLASLPSNRNDLRGNKYIARISCANRMYVDSKGIRHSAKDVFILVINLEGESEILRIQIIGKTSPVFAGSIMFYPEVYLPMPIVHD